MEFARPTGLWLLALVPVLLALLWLDRRRRHRDWAVLGLTGQPPGDGGGAWVLASVLLAVAMAQPRWGRQDDDERPPGRDVVLLIDVSWSMAAEDVVPDRLGKAVEAASQLIRALGREPGDRVSVVAFAGRGVIRCPLTGNLGAAIEALESLRPGAIVPGGTNLGLGLDAAMDAFDDQEHAEGRVVVVISDGEDHEQSWPDRLDRLRDLGVVVHSVAIGDAEHGHPIPIDNPTAGNGSGLLTYRGEMVLSKRSDTALRGVSLATGGVFVPLGIAEANLASLYEQQIAPATRQARSMLRTPERVERFPLFVLMALAIGLIGSWPRRRRWSPRWSRVMLGIAMALVFPGAGGEALTVDELIEAGNLAFERGDFDESLAAFQKAHAMAPADPIPDYNAAAVLYQFHRFEDARTRYRLAREHADDDGLRMKIDYALGNVSVALRDIPAALRHYDACLSSTVSGPEFDRIRHFARDNRAFAERLATPGSESTDGQSDDGPGNGPDRSDDNRGDGDGVRDGDGSSHTGRAPPAGIGDDIANQGGGPTGSQRIGGGGGTSRGGPPVSTTPSDRLAQAVEAIRQARNRRPPEPPPIPPGSSDQKNW